MRPDYGYQGFPAIDDRDQILQVMASKEVYLPPSLERVEFCCDEGGRRDDADFQIV